MSETYLIHYGILGQKHGRRNYQNPDGTYTDEGLRRKYAQSGVKPSRGRLADSNWFKPTIKAGKDKPNVSPVEKVVKESRNITDNTKNLIDDVRGLRKKKSVDLSGLSNEDLQKVITRKNLERNYLSVTNEENSRGYEITKSVLDSVGDLLAIGASAASIYVVAKGLKG